jgi:hypothetical protein
MTTLQTPVVAITFCFLNHMEMVAKLKLLKARLVYCFLSKTEGKFYGPMKGNAENPQRDEIPG